MYIAIYPTLYILGINIRQCKPTCKYFILETNPLNIIFIHFRNLEIYLELDRAYIFPLSN